MPPKTEKKIVEQKKVVQQKVPPKKGRGKHQDYAFYAEATDGFFIKVLFDILKSNTLSRIILSVRKNGIFGRDTDQAKTMLFDICLKRTGFRAFRCYQPMDFSFNVTHLHRLIRSTKKKDMMILYVDKNQPDKLFIKIMSKKNTSGVAPTRVQTVDVIIQQEEEAKSIALPAKKAYRYPMVLSNKDFQVKKQSSVAKEMNVVMQSNNYISFLSGCGTMYSSKLEFGEIVEKPEEYEEDSDSSDHEDSDEELEDDGEEEDEEEEDKEDDEEDLRKKAGLPDVRDKISPDTKIMDDKYIYRAKFSMDKFDQIAKLPSLSNQLQFFAPMIQGYPLKIKAGIGTIGTIMIYIKDMTQIIYEKSLSQQDEEVVDVAPKQRRRYNKTK